MNRKIFRAIFFSTFVSLILALGAVLFITHEDIASIEQDRLSRLNAVLASGYNHLGMDFIKQSAKADSPYRITLIAPDGTVLFDSRAESPLDNHLNRTEVDAALKEGYGSAERYSATFETQTFYYARTLTDGNVLRAAITTDHMLTFTLRLTTYFALILLIFGALALFLASKISAAILEPLYSIDLNHPLLNDCYDEIKPFLTEIDKKQRQLDRQMQLMRSRNEEFLIIT